MPYRIEEVEGIGPSYATKLAQADIYTTEELLEACCDPKGRKRVSEQIGLSEKLLLEWANLADLMRIRGIGPQYSELLEAAGVDTVKELRTRKPDNLATKMAEVRAQKRLTRIAPGESMVREWIEQAKSVEPRITY